MSTSTKMKLQNEYNSKTKRTIHFPLVPIRNKEEYVPLSTSISFYQHKVGLYIRLSVNLNRTRMIDVRGQYDTSTEGHIDTLGNRDLSSKCFIKYMNHSTKPVLNISLNSSTLTLNPIKHLSQSNLNSRNILPFFSK